MSSDRGRREAHPIERDGNVSCLTSDLRRDRDRGREGDSDFELPGAARSRTDADRDRQEVVDTDVEPQWADDASGDVIGRNGGGKGGLAIRERLGLVRDADIGLIRATYGRLHQVVVITPR